MQEQQAVALAPASPMLRLRLIVLFERKLSTTNYRAVDTLPVRYRSHGDGRHEQHWQLTAQP